MHNLAECYLLTDENKAKELQNRILNALEADLM
jgi:hypothetical protein